MWGIDVGSIINPHKHPNDGMTKKILASFLSLFALAAGASEPILTRAPANPGPLTPIAALDVPRYMGTWYEIAKYPNWFQKKCTGETRAEYTLRPDGQVQVINRCRLESGEMNQAIGTARRLGPSSSPKLEVRFAPAWLSFLPFVWGDYWVVDLDERYQLVAVSEPKQEYLWILSRSKTVDPAAYQQLLERLARKGYDLQKLELTRQ